MRRFTILFVLALLVSSIAPLSPATFAKSTDAPIRLKATTFSPGLGEKPDIPPGLTIAAPPAGAPGYYLVQFNGPIQPVWKAELASLGAEILDYIPEFAFKVRMTPAVAGQARRLDAVNWVGIFQPAYKISPDLDGAGLIRVDLTAAADAGAVKAQIAGLGGAIVKGGGRSLTVQIDPQQVPALAHLAEVAWIEAEPEFKLYNNIARTDGGGMDAYAMWDLGIYGEGQIAAAADTGLDTNNPDTVHLDFSGRVVQIDVLGNLSTDTDGHGTHTSGSIVGNGVRSGTDPATQDYGQYLTSDPNVVSEKVTGIAPEAQLYFQAIANYHPRWGLTLGGLPSDLNQLFQPPYNAGARVHSNSWGSDVAGAYTTSSQDVDEFMWNNVDMLVTTSAGNAGIDGDNNGYVDEDSMGSPATAKNVLTVGATENARTNGGVNPEVYTNDIDEVQCSGNGGGPAWRNCWPDDYDAAPTGPDHIGGNDNHDHMAAFSSRGPTDDGRIKPDVVAPGTNILSVKSSRASDCGWGGGHDDFYCMMGGTSMSNPLTAGAAVLVQDWYEDIKGHANPSAALVKATLINTAVDIAGYGDAGWEAALPIPNNHEGWGRVNLANVAADGREFYDGASVSTGGSASYNFDVSNGQTFKVTLVWSDYPGSTTASTALVNDLDLVVTGPGGTYNGNVFSGGWSQTGGSADRINNVENVYVQSAAGGTWTVEVQGYNTPYGPQPFALVVDGGGSSGGDTPPSVSIANPAEGSTVSGTVAVQIDATDAEDPAGTLTVEWNVNGGAWQPTTYTGGYYVANWDSTTVGDGDVTLNARATDSASNVSNDSNTVEVDNVNDPPVATFTYDCTDLTCDFDASGSYDPDGTIDSYVWDFDGTPGSGVTASHTFPADGTYNVILTVTDNEAATDDDQQLVTVSDVNLPPVASFTYSCTDLACDFDASGSYDTDGTIVSYVWDFAGSPGSGVTASYTFPTDGTYPVTLTVTDNEGAIDTDTQSVSVTSGGGGDTMHISAIDMWYDPFNRNKGYIMTQVTIVDDADNPVPDATVYLEIALPGGGTATGSAETLADGTVTFSLSIKASATGDYTSTVTDVTHATYIYDPDANVETSETYTHN